MIFEVLLKGIYEIDVNFTSLEEWFEFYLNICLPEYKNKKIN